MRCVIQRTAKSKVVVAKKTIGEIDSGLTILVGFTEGDNMDTIRWMANKILNLRIFPDDTGTMNKSILDYGGKILSISQFTLYADCKKGNRPSYLKALKNNLSYELYEKFNQELKKNIEVETGEFGADMEVEINNIGPTTIIMER